MKILVLGSTGMLGHQLVKSLSVNHEVKGATRRDFHAENPGSLAWMLDSFGADVIINCAGIVKQRNVDPDTMIRVNAAFPHELARLARHLDARLIHFSTDCVFSGRKGSYTENDEPDPQDLYGRSKLLGEVSDQGCITLRTSIVGRELTRRTSLVEWFLQQEGIVHGYNNVHFSGVTTIEMGRIVERILHSPYVHGIWHVGGQGIDKYDLLRLLQIYYPMCIELVKDPRPKSNRVLRSDRFQQYFGYTPPSWGDMIKEMANAER